MEERGMSSEKLVMMLLLAEQLGFGVVLGRAVRRRTLGRVGN